jgi:hypothetical protein
MIPTPPRDSAARIGDELEQIARKVEKVRDIYRGIGVFSAHDLTQIAGELRSLSVPEPDTARLDTPADFARRCAENARTMMLFDVAERFDKIATEIDKS